MLKLQTGIPTIMIRFDVYKERLYNDFIVDKELIIQELENY
jgi:hypothetical protein